MSPQLEVAKLNLNRLSGDLPHSVLHWGKNPNMTEDGLKLDLLTGNLFSCPPTHGLRAIFGPTLGQDTPLYELDVAGATYQCGTQGWYYPFLESALATLSLVAAAAYTWHEQRFTNALHGEYWSRRNRRFWADDDLGAATANAAALGAVIVAVSTIAVVAMLPLYVGDRSLSAAPPPPPPLPLVQRTLKSITTNQNRLASVSITLTTTNRHHCHPDYIPPSGT